MAGEQKAQGLKLTFWCRLAKGGSLFAVLALSVFLFRYVEPNTVFFSAFVDERIRGAGAWGILLFAGLGAGLASVGVPRLLLAFAAGYAFGPWWGCLWATTAAVAGCAITFSYARYLGQAAVHRRFGGRIARLERFLLQGPFTMAVIIRCLPVGNNTVTNVLAGVSLVPLLPFLAGSFVGYVPQNFIFSLLGSGFHVDPLWRTVVSAALFAMATLFGGLLYARFKRSLDEEEKVQEERDE